MKNNDFVRLSKMKRTFEKGYMPNWTEEIFKVTSTKTAGPVAARKVYKLSDWDGEPIEGVFYPEEVQRVVLGNQEDHRFVIEKILKKKKLRGGAGGELYLVKWRGYPDKFNSWVNKKDVVG